MSTLVLLSGGTGTRMGLDVPKQYITVCGRSVIGYSLEIFMRNLNIDNVVIVAELRWRKFIEAEIKKCSVIKPFFFAAPGDTRQGSIYNALKRIDELSICSDYDVVVIHDAARPLVEEEIVNASFSGISGFDGVLPVIPIKDTIYQSKDGNQISDLLCRDELFAGQAPESFIYGKYYGIHKKCTKEEIDCTKGSSEIAFKYGLNIHLIKGSERNFKITTLEDLMNFENIIKNTR